ncbi:MAG: helix-turn-helix domain-containing protein [Deltaproteobacteria bacterium]|nr:helix-turn-helix domain-containing protein [Deltaproteobacteria bacterium]
MKIGEKLKALRLEQGLSLEQLAVKVGVTRGFLSQVEKDKTSPSLSSLVKILGALEVRLGDFFQSVEERRGAVLRKGDRKYYNEEGKCKVASLAAGFSNPKIEPFYVELEPEVEQERVAGQGETFAYVLHGRVELLIDEEKSVLQAEDSIYFDGRVPHSIRAIGKERAQVIFVTDTSIVTIL